MVLLLLISLGIAGTSISADGIPSRSLFAYKAFSEPGMAMEPTIAPGDIVYVDMTYFKANHPKVGDVVLYKVKSLAGPTMKRIIALGGNRVQIKDAKLMVDGRVVVEPYLKRGGAATAYSKNWGPVKLPTGCIFLLGDFRDSSQDSRVDGCSSTPDLMGLARYILSAAGSREFHKVH